MAVSPGTQAVVWWFPEGGGGAGSGGTVQCTDLVS